MILLKILYEKTLSQKILQNKNTVKHTLKLVQNSYILKLFNLYINEKNNLNEFKNIYKNNLLS